MIQSRKDNSNRSREVRKGIYITRLRRKYLTLRGLCGLLFKTLLLGSHRGQPLNSKFSTKARDHVFSHLLLLVLCECGQADSSIFKVAFGVPGERMRLPGVKYSRRGRRLPPWEKGTLNSYYCAFTAKQQTSSP